MSNNKRKLIASAVTAGFVFVGGGVDAMAEATGYLSIANGHDAVASGNHSVAYGAYSSASGYESVAVGKNTTSSGDSAVAIGRISTSSGHSAVAIGRSSTSSGVWSTAVGPGSKATKNLSTAIGGQAQANGDMSVALGAQSKVKSGDGNVVSVGNDNLKRKIINVANGVNANDAVNKSQLDAVETKVNKKVDAGTVGAPGNASLAVGDRSTSTGYLSTAMGVNSNASGGFSMALGFGAQATAGNSVALGRDAVADQGNTVSVGNATTKRRIVNVANGTADNDAVNKSQLDAVETKVNKKVDAGTVGAAGNASLAVGERSNSTGYLSIAMGVGSDASGGQSMSLGINSKATASGSVALGSGSVADQANTISVGSSTNKRRIVNVANGTAANDAVNKSQLDAVEAKINNKVDKGTVGPNGGQAIGAGSKANGAGALALGNASEADGYIATAVGYGHALDTYTVAMGVNAYAYNVNGIAIGTLAKAGATNKDYANADIFNRIDPETGKPLYNFSPGYDPRNIRSGAIAIGNLAKAVGYRNTAIGEDAKAGIIIERDDYNHPKKFGLGAVGATAIGAAAIAGGSQATVVGNGAVAEGKISVGMGTRSYTTGKADTAVGTYSVVTEDSAVALGAYARADHKNSVALGNSSITEDVKATASTTINGKEYTFAGGDQSQVVGTVSIGGQGVLGYTDTTDRGHWNDPANATNGNGRTDMDNAIYRTITNVAAGRINEDSTDAINGSQLYAVMGATEENRKLIENNAINLAQTDHRINRRIDSVEEESRAGDAMNAALAALKPLQYDPNEKFQVMAGTGRFKDKQGFALGVAHHINENLLLNAGAAYSGSKYKIWNAGITYRFGSSNQKAPVIKVSNDEQRIRSLEQENMMLKQRLAAIEAKLSKLK
ncbi:YadA-like family protein [Gallibacterium anatis]|uniref:YadA-like family protein n=1 Tax=Gallibacterium anatis TaxID=750 RepID=UPI00254F1192|nr:YadA-like family protein [Gallibacterium anatis]WIM82423.1 YadA-like family protein [Gallibacterium anatis]